MSKITDELLNQLSGIDTLPELMHFTETVENADFPLSYSEHLTNLLLASSMTAGELIRRSGIQRNYGYQILSGQKNPGRDKVISFCLALHLSFEETQRSLTIAKESILYPKNKRDSIIIFCLQKKLSVQDTNDLLYEMNETVL